MIDNLHTKNTEWKMSEQGHLLIKKKSHIGNEKFWFIANVDDLIGLILNVKDDVKKEVVDNLDIWFTVHEKKLEGFSSKDLVAWLKEQ